MTKDLDHMRDVASAIEPYMDLEGSELGEAVRSVINLLYYYYCISDELWDTLMKEAEQMLKTFQEDFEIVEEEYTTTHKSRELREKI